MEDNGVVGTYTIVITNKAFGPKMTNRRRVNPYELRHIHQLDRRYGDVPNRIILLMLDLLKTDPEITNPIEEWAYDFKPNL